VAHLGSYSSPEYSELSNYTRAIFMPTTQVKIMLIGLEMAAGFE
jgi:hypothetical protein